MVYQQYAGTLGRKPAGRSCTRSALDVVGRVGGERTCEQLWAWIDDLRVDGDLRVCVCVCVCFPSPLPLKKMFQNPLDARTLHASPKKSSHSDSHSDSHGESTIDALQSIDTKAKLELWLKIMKRIRSEVPGDLNYTPLPLFLHLNSLRTEDGVTTLSFLLEPQASPTVSVGGRIADIDSPLLRVEEESDSIDWRLSEEVCFYANYHNMNEHYKFNKRRNELIRSGVPPQQAENMALELATWKDEICFEWFTTTKDPSKFYAWRNGVARLMVALSHEERAKRIASWRRSETPLEMPNNEKLVYWETLGVIERVQVDFCMPVSAVSTFAITKRRVAGKRARTEMVS